MKAWQLRQVYIPAVGHVEVTQFTYLLRDMRHDIFTEFIYLH